MELFDCWIHINENSSSIYSQEEYLIPFSSDSCVKSQKLQVYEQPLNIETGDFGIRKSTDQNGKVKYRIRGDIYPFRVAIYDDDYIATYDIKKHQRHEEGQRIFYQDSFKVTPPGSIDTRIGFSPIIHIVPRLTWTDFEDGIRPAERFFRITDSSIWNYFVADKADFDRAIKDIRKNWKNKYYHLYIAKEFADLNARLTIESFLYEFGIQEGHAGAVSPFLFHSERGNKRHA